MAPNKRYEGEKYVCYENSSGSDNGLSFGCIIDSNFMGIWHTAM